jgi:UTP--glucose-1-phosphate uridylyltransferase
MGVLFAYPCVNPRFRSIELKTTRAVITAAGRNQRNLALQTLIDRDGRAKSVLQVLIEEATRAGVEDICVVVCPGDEAA